MNDLIRSAPTRLVITGELQSVAGLEAALASAHRQRHISAIILMAPSPGAGAARSATAALIRQWADRNNIAVQSWLFVPSEVSLCRWLEQECQADAVLALPNDTSGLTLAARKLGITVLAADGATEIVGRPRPRRDTLRMFPPRIRPGRALQAAA